MTKNPDCDCLHCNLILNSHDSFRLQCLNKFDPFDAFAARFLFYSIDFSKGDKESLNYINSKWADLSKNINLTHLKSAESGFSCRCNKRNCKIYCYSVGTFIYLQQKGDLPKFSDEQVVYSSETFDQDEDEQYNDINDEGNLSHTISCEVIDVGSIDFTFFYKIGGFDGEIHTNSTAQELNDAEIFNESTPGQVERRDGEGSTSSTYDDKTQPDSSGKLMPSLRRRKEIGFQDAVNSLDLTRFSQDGEFLENGTQILRRRKEKGFQDAVNSLDLTRFSQDGEFLENGTQILRRRKEKGFQDAVNSLDLVRFSQDGEFLENGTQIVIVSESVETWSFWWHDSLTMQPLKWRTPPSGIT